MDTGISEIDSQNQLTAMTKTILKNLAVPKKSRVLV